MTAYASVKSFSDNFEELARFREGLYRVFAAAYRPPQPERFLDIITACEPLESMGLRCLTVYRKWRPWRDASCDSDEVGADYVRTFSTGVSGTDMPLTEPFRTAVPVRDEMGGALGDLARMYDEIRLEPNGGISDELDHVSIELEIMSTLCAREAVARAEENDRNLELALSSQVAFLDRHLGCWLPQFVERIASTNAVPFYTKLGPTIASFVHHDTGVAHFLVGNSTKMEPSR